MPVTKIKTSSNSNIQQIPLSKHCMNLTTPRGVIIKSSFSNIPVYALG